MAYHVKKKAKMDGERDTLPYNWQAGCCGIAERAESVLQAQQWTDCEFAVGESGERIRAHRLLLASASPVFEAMFFGPLAESKFPIVVTDVAPEVFKEMLRAITSNEAHITSLPFACELHYTAKKYMLPYLQSLCSTCLVTYVEPRTACFLLEYANFVEEEALQRRCVQVIQNQTSEVLKSHTIEETTMEIMKWIFSLAPLGINSELELLRAAEKYARAQHRKNREPSQVIDITTDLPITPRTSMAHQKPDIWSIATIIKQTDSSKTFDEPKTTSVEELRSLYHSDSSENEEIGSDKSINKETINKTKDYQTESSETRTGDDERVKDKELEFDLKLHKGSFKAETYGNSENDETFPKENNNRNANKRTISKFLEPKNEINDSVMEAFITSKSFDHVGTDLKVLDQDDLAQILDAQTNESQNEIPLDLVSKTSFKCKKKTAADLVKQSTSRDFNFQQNAFQSTFKEPQLNTFNDLELQQRTSKDFSPRPSTFEGFSPETRTSNEFNQPSASNNFETEQSTTKGCIPLPNTSKEPQPSKCNDFNPQPSTFKEISPQAISFKEFVPQPSTSKDYASQPSTCRDFTPQPSTSKDFSPQPTTSKKKSPQPSTSKDFSSQPGTSKDFSSQPGTSKDFSSQPGTSKDFSPQPSTSKIVSPQPSTSKDFSPQPSPSKRVDDNPSPGRTRRRRNSSRVTEIIEVVTDSDSDPEVVTEEVVAATPVIPARPRKKPRLEVWIGGPKQDSPIRPLLHLIRFLTLSPQDFAECTTLCTLLSGGEIYSLLMNICSRHTPVPMPKGFSTSRVQRTQIQRNISTLQISTAVTDLDKSRTRVEQLITINSISGLQSYHSAPFYLMNMPWRLVARPEFVVINRDYTGKYLSLFVECNWDSAAAWQCRARVKFALLPQYLDAREHELAFSCTFSQQRPIRGYSTFAPWEDVVSRGYVRNDAISVLVTVTRAEEDMPPPVPQHRWHPPLESGKSRALNLSVIGTFGKIIQGQYRR